MSFTQGPHHLRRGVEDFGTIKERCPGVLFLIGRSANRNVVVYERKASGIDAYWLDIEPSHVESARRRGRTHDRDEFSIMDHRPYGFALKGNVMTMNVYPAMPITLQGNRALVRVGGKVRVLNSIYAHVSYTLGIPTGVSRLDIVTEDGWRTSVRP